jgi:transcription elongation GreA/GreB family factor
MTRRTLQEYRALGDSASLEDDWIAEVESSPEDLDYFLGLALPLAASGEEERARSLVELYDTELRDKGLWKLRLELLRRAGNLVEKASRLQKEIVATLEKIWGDRAHFRSLLTHVGLHKPNDQPAKIWDQVNRLQSLLLYDVGEVVAMAGQGVGRVVEVNLPLETLKIDFERSKGVTVGFRAAAKMLTPLPPGHLLRRKLDEPESLSRLRDEQPAELLRAVLESADGPLTGAEIRDMLAGVVSEAQWTAWWNAARKHPQVVGSTGGRQSYRWERSTAGALATIRKSFERAQPSELLELFRKHGARDASLAEAMARTILHVSGELRRDNPAFAFEAWIALERAGRLPQSPEWSLPDLFDPSADVRVLFAGLTDRQLRERAFATLRELREDWPAVYRDQLSRETDPRVLDILAAGLAEVEGDELGRTFDNFIAQPRKYPAAFVWLAERAANEDLLRSRIPLRLLQQIVAALASADFAGYRTRLKALLESGGTVPRLFAHLTEEQAAPAIEVIGKGGGLEPFQRESLKNAILLRFPSLREESSRALYATADAIAAKRAEIRQLAEIDIPANRKAIEEARSMGDLRENFEYKSARERHEYLNARLAKLHRDLGRVRPIDFANLDLSEVRIGSSVELRGAGGAALVYTILGPWESRPEQNILSYESELGAKLLGLAPGVETTIQGERYEVVRIAPAAAAAVTP